MRKTVGKTVLAGKIPIGGGNPLVLIAGPCVVEQRSMIMRTAEFLKQTATRYGIPLIFKSSYKKANRTREGSFTGLPMEKALRILQEVKEELDLPILTDIHLPEEAPVAAEIADIVQIPAFLCRQTELLHAAGKTGKVVNIKKGQFLAPADIIYAAEKVIETKNQKILLTERGTTFGYNNLVVDMRSLVIMRKTGFPVILDATHSVQLPSAAGGISGGQPEFIFPIARAGVAAGCDGIFIETHPSPKKALSDPHSQLPLHQVPELIRQIVSIHTAVMRSE